MAPNSRPHDSESMYKSDAAPLSPPSGGDYFAIHAFLRLVLLAASVASIILMVTAKETELVAVPGLPTIRVPVEAKFNQSPAFIYLISAMSVTGLYSILTGVASLGAMSKPNAAHKYLLYFAIWDALLLGIVAAATGAAGGAGYIGLKGNSHAGYRKICNSYGKYCRHFGSSIGLSLVGSILLVLLITLSVVSLHRRIPK